MTYDQGRIDGIREGLETALGIASEQREKWEAKAQETAARLTARSRKTLIAQDARAAACRMVEQRIRTALGQHDRKHPPAAQAASIPAKVRGAIARLGL